MALAVPLHHVGAFLVVDIADGGAGVGGDALAVEPFCVNVADGVGREGAQMGDVEGGGGEAGTVAEDAAAGGVEEHAVAEVGDEVGLGGCFAEGGDEVCGGLAMDWAHGWEGWGYYLLVWGRGSLGGRTPGLDLGARCA